MNNHIMKIYIRSDLKMRKGKMAAQAAHAAMKLMLEVMDKNNDTYIISNENEKRLADLLLSNSPENQIQIVFVKDEIELYNRLNSETIKTTITDHGRTEFHGIKTLTCAASGFFEKPVIHKIIPHEEETENRCIFSKQMIIFDKSNPLSKETACQLAVLNCLKIVFYNIKNKKLNINNNSEFSLWLRGAFAKISLSIKTKEDLNSLLNDLTNANIKAYISEIGNNCCLIIEPKFSENIDPYTRNLSLI